MIHPQFVVLAAENEATEVIRVSTSVPADRFDQRKELAQEGEREGLKAVERLKAKYGF